MHAVALKLIMNKDVKEVSSWFGYKRDITYARSNGVTAKSITGNAEDFWDEAENLSVIGKETLDKITVRIQQNAEDDMINLVKRKLDKSAESRRSPKSKRGMNSSVTYEPLFPEDQKSQSQSHLFPSIREPLVKQTVDSFNAERHDSHNANSMNEDEHND